MGSGSLALAMSHVAGDGGVYVAMSTYNFSLHNSSISLIVFDSEPCFSKSAGKLPLNTPVFVSMSNPYPTLRW